MRSLVILLVVLFAAPCLAQDRYQIRQQYRYSSRYDFDPPKIYAGDGTYLGELSSNRYSLDSISNPYGLYGSKYSIDSINNPYGLYGRYSTQPIYIFPSSRWQRFVR